MGWLRRRLDAKQVAGGLQWAASRGVPELGMGGNLWGAAPHKLPPLKTRGHICDRLAIELSICCGCLLVSGRRIWRCSLYLDLGGQIEDP